MILWESKSDKWSLDLEERKKTEQKIERTREKTRKKDRTREREKKKMEKRKAKINQRWQVLPFYHGFNRAQWKSFHVRIQ